MNYDLVSHKIKTSGIAALVATTLIVSGGSVASAMPDTDSSVQTPVTASADETSHANQAMTEHAEHSQPQQPVDHANSQKAVELRIGLNNLLREHVTTSLSVTHALAGNQSASIVEGAEQAQYANSDALAAAIGSIYGSEAQGQFSTLFREHIYQSNAYAKAVGAGDRGAADAANAELKGYLQDISDFFVGAIPGLKYNEVYSLLNEHEELINKSTDAYKAGDYVQAYQMEREALKQITIASDALSTGIVSTNPDKF